MVRICVHFFCFNILRFQILLGSLWMWVCLFFVCLVVVVCFRRPLTRFVSINVCVVIFALQCAHRTPCIGLCDCPRFVSKCAYFVFFPSFLLIMRYIQIFRFFSHDLVIILIQCTVFVALDFLFISRCLKGLYSISRAAPMCLLTRMCTVLCLCIDCSHKSVCLMEIVQLKMYHQWYGADDIYLLLISLWSCFMFFVFFFQFTFNSFLFIAAVVVVVAVLIR